MGGAGSLTRQLGMRHLLRSRALAKASIPPLCVYWIASLFLRINKMVWIELQLTIAESHSELLGIEEMTEEEIEEVVKANYHYYLDLQLRKNVWDAEGSDNYRGLSNFISDLCNLHIGHSSYKSDSDLYFSVLHISNPDNEAQFS